MLGNDSGPSHLAAAMGLQTLVVYGPTDPALYRPLGPRVKVFKGDKKTFTSDDDQSLQDIIVKTILS